MSLSNGKRNRYVKNRFLKWLLIVAGTISMGLGFIGIFVPLLPTTPFLLLSAACYIKSSEKFYNWLMNNRLLGRYLRDYIENKGMALNAKITTITILWITIGVSAFLFVDSIYLKVILFVIAAGVTIHLVKMKTMRRKPDTESLNEI